MLLGTKCKTSLCIEINGQKCMSSDKVKLLGITIDWKLQFNTHVNELCDKANKKVAALMRLRNKLSVEQKTILSNSFISSQFGYCPLVWMFCGKSVNHRINRVHHRTLKALYNDFNSSYAQLLLKGNHKTLHQINLQKLIIKVYKCLKGECPQILSNIFVTNQSLSYNLRINNLLVLPKRCSTVTYGLQTFRYRGSATWNTLPDKLKESVSLSVLKERLKELSINCSCKICLNC